MPEIETPNPDQDKWKLLKEAVFESFKLNGIKAASHTMELLIHIIVGVVAMKQESFLGTNRRNEDLRAHGLILKVSRGGKGLFANHLILLLKPLIGDKEVIISKKLTEAGLIGGTEVIDKKRVSVPGLCNRLFIYRDEFQRDIEYHNPSNDVMGTLRINCNNYKEPDNMIKNNARSQHDFEAYPGRATILATCTPAVFMQYKTQLNENGTVERFLIDFKALSAQDSNEILDSLKLVRISKEERAVLLQKQRENTKAIHEILNSIQHSTIYINDNYLNEIIEQSKKKVQDMFSINQYCGDLMHSLQVSVLKNTMKSAARIALVRGKKTIDREELQEAFLFCDTLMVNLIEEMQMFSGDMNEKSSLIKQCREVLGDNLYSKTERNRLLMEHWGVRSTRSLYSKLNTIKGAFQKVGKQWKLK